MEYTRFNKVWKEQVEPIYKQMIDFENEQNS